MPVQPVAMVVLACRVLAIAVALSCLVRAEAYLSTESGKTYECDITKVDAFTASENKDRCLFQVPCCALVSDVDCVTYSSVLGHAGEGGGDCVPCRPRQPFHSRQVCMHV